MVSISSTRKKTWCKLLRFRSSNNHLQRSELQSCTCRANKRKHIPWPQQLPDIAFSSRVFPSRLEWQKKERPEPSPTHVFHRYIYDVRTSHTWASRVTCGVTSDVRNMLDGNIIVKIFRDMLINFTIYVQNPKWVCPMSEPSFGRREFGLTRNQLH